MAGENQLGFVGNNENPLDPATLNQSQQQQQPQLVQQPQAPPPQTQASPQQMAQTADVAHHSLLGRAFRSLMGNQVNYSVDPQTGKLQTSESEQKPGAIWRGILAGALLGSATAVKNKQTGFTQGLVTGANAIEEEAQKKDLIKRQQAQQEFQNQLTAEAAQRGGKAFETEQKLREAQIAFHNAQTLRENHLAQSEDMAYHDNLAKHGKDQITPYIDAGLPYEFKDVGEDEYNKLLQSNPRAAHLLWEPTGTRVVINSEGKPDHVATYSAVDPKGNVKLTSDWIKRAKEAGLDQVYGSNTFNVLAKDKELTASQYMTMNQQLQDLTNKQQADKKTKFDEEKESAGIARIKAETSHFKAEAAKLYGDLEDRKILTEAWDAYLSGGDLSKLSAKAKSALSKGLTDIIKTQVDELKALPKDPVTGQLADQDRAKSLYKQTESYQGLLDKLYGIKPTEEKLGVGSASTNSPVPSLSESGKRYISSVLLDTVGQPIQSKENAGKIIWDDDRVPADQKLAITKSYDAIMPWKAVVSFSGKIRMNPETAAAQLKAAGIRVENAPTEEAKPTKPEDVSTSQLE